MIRIAHWIGGAEHAGTSGRVGPVFNPATGEQVAEVDLASAAEVGAAVATAERAARSWRSASLSRRSAVLFKFRELLNDRKDEVAALLTAEHG
ncbi:MAG TPA: aldehyde dehydrogenase family protein, partial [Actinoplanes sp.]